MAAKHVSVSSHYFSVMHLLVKFLKLLSHLFTGAIIETKKAARFKVAVSPPLFSLPFFQGETVNLLLRDANRLNNN